MTLSERLSEYVRAAFSGIWVQSHEHDDAVAEIARLCRQNGWTLATWDIDRGLGLNGQTAETAQCRLPPIPCPPSSPRCPRHARRHGDPGRCRNFHRFLGSAEIVQALDSAISKGKQDRTFVVILSPVVQIPVELERAFVVVEHELPGREQLEQIARGIATEPGDLPEGDDLGMVLDAAAGLTRVEAENAFSLSLGAARAGRARDPLGTQDGDAQEDGAADPAPGRRDLRRPGRPRRSEGVHPEGAGQPQGLGPGQGRPAPGRAGDREVGVRKGVGQRDGPSDAGPGCRRP